MNFYCSSVYTGVWGVCVPWYSGKIRRSVERKRSVKSSYKLEIMEFLFHVWRCSPNNLKLSQSVVWVRPAALRSDYFTFWGSSYQGTGGLWGALEGTDVLCFKWVFQRDLGGCPVWGQVARPVLNLDGFYLFAFKTCIILNSLPYHCVGAKLPATQMPFRIPVTQFCSYKICSIAYCVREC